MKKLLFVLLFLLIVAGAALYWMKGRGEKLAPLDARNATYLIENKPVTLVNGMSTEPAATGSASQITTQYFGNEARGDLNGDGFDDLALLITQSGGSSGMFFYAVVAINTPNGYRGTNAVLLGDRIAPQSTEIRDGEVIVNYGDRKPDEPMTAIPSQGVTKYLNIEDGSLVEVVKPPMATVQIYYYDAAKDSGTDGNVACSPAGLVPVGRQVPQTDTIIADTITELLHGSSTPQEKSQGLAANFPLAGVVLTNSKLENGTLTLTFADPEHKTSGGACRANILRMQIESTAKQFKGVSAVQILPKDTFQP